MNISTNTKGIVLVVLSSLMLGSYGTWSKLIGSSFGVFYQGWTISLLIAVILSPILFYNKEIVWIKKEDWKWMAVYLISTSLTRAPLFYAFNHMDIGTATLLFFVSMLLTMYGVGFIFLKEQLNLTKGLAFIIAFGGLYITFSFSLTTFALLAILMAILNGVASGGEVAISKKLSGAYSALYLTWLSWVIIFITNGIASFALGETQYLPALTMPWAYLVGYAIASLLGFWLVIAGFKYVEASIGGLLGLLEIIFSIGLGILIFHEGLTTRVVIGGLLILVAAALPHIADLMKRGTTIPIS